LEGIDFKALIIDDKQHRKLKNLKTHTNITVALALGIDAEAPK